MKVSLIQMNSVSDKAGNLAQARRLVERAVAEERPDWVLLPEVFDWMGGTSAEKLAIAEPATGGPAYETLRKLAAENRIWVHGGSFFERVPDGCDAYIMKHIIHDWSDEHCRTILKRMRDKLPTNGRVLVCEMVVTDEPGPTPAKMLDIEMLVMTVGGKERTKDEFAELFASSGLRLSRIVATERPFCLIEAVPGLV